MPPIVNTEEMLFSPWKMLPMTSDLGGEEKKLDILPQGMVILYGVNYHILFPGKTSNDTSTCYQALRSCSGYEGVIMGYTGCYKNCETLSEAKRWIAEDFRKLFRESSLSSNYVRPLKIML